MSLNDKFKATETSLFQPCYLDKLPILTFEHRKKQSLICVVSQFLLLYLRTHSTNTLSTQNSEIFPIDLENFYCCYKRKEYFKLLSLFQRLFQFMIILQCFKTLPVQYSALKTASIRPFSKYLPIFPHKNLQDLARIS